MTGAALPLHHLRVLDLSEGVAGAYCTKLLGDAGASVVKVEAPGGDPLRRWWASGRGDGPPGTGALFEWLAGGARSVVADLDTDDGRALVRGLAADHDVVVESAGPGRLEATGLGVGALQAVNPALSVVSVSPFGAGAGPDVPAASTEFTLQALGGSIHGRGWEHREGVYAAGRPGEWAAGLYLAIGALVAWRRARATGRGDHVDVSVLEAVTAAVVGAYRSVNRSFDLERPMRTRNPELPSVEPAADGWVGLCTVTGQQWQSFAAMIGRPDLADPPEWMLLDERLRHLDETVAVIHGWTTRHTVAEVLAECEAFRVPAAPVGNGATIPGIELFEALGTYRAHPRTDAPPVLAPRPPYRCSRTAVRPPSPAPRLGEHTEAVRAEAAAGAARAARRGPAAARPAAPEPAAATGARAAAGSFPFAGVRIVDFTQFWAGPFVSELFAQLGADVVKVESLARPDPMRFGVPGRVGGPGVPAYERCAFFNTVNLSKRGVTLALDTPDGRDLALRLVATADVVVENFTPRVMDGFGLGWEDVRGARHDVVMLRMPAFGLRSPWRDRGGFAQTMEQLSGMAWTTGYADGPPLIPKGMCDPLAGLHAAFALAAALEHRDRTGEGQLVEAVMVEGACNVAAEIVIEHQAYGRLLERDGNRGPAACPQGVYRCVGDDAWVAVAVETDGQWEALREALGDPGWARGPGLATVAGRRRAHDLVDRGLAGWAATRTAGEAAAALDRAGVPAAPCTPSELVDTVAPMRARGFFAAVPNDRLGTHEFPTQPMRIASLPGYRLFPAPRLGEHNDEVLGGELGLAPGELARLREAGVIGETLGA